jgi:peptidoglycan L-alanyl-D-glutamate endopeptidase CwlK
MRRLIFFMIFCFGICPVIHAGKDAFHKAHCYIRAYPDFFIGYKDGCLIAKDGRKIPFDDGIGSKDYDQMIVDCRIGDKAFDPEDAFYWEYHAGSEVPTVDRPPLGDPGRIRPAEIFSHMYGSSKSQRMKKMRRVQWVGLSEGKVNSILVTTVNGVDKAVEKVARELRDLPEEKKQELEGIVFNVDACSGYCDRSVRDYPHRTSGHAYGIAVDEPYRYRNNMPQFLVDIFERHGFIWGGRWHSYDVMHFEYRPELLLNDPAYIRQSALLKP